MSEVKQTNKAHGYYWFEKDTMRFFRSRVSNAVYGGRYFISSEQFDYESPRLYTIREAYDDGGIHDASEFQEFTSWQQAKHAIDALLKEESGVKQ